MAVAWPYVNGDIHIGHLAGYLLPADIFARFHRLIGNEVLMVSGSDCFGTPITLEADKRGVRPEVIVEEYHEKNKKLFLDTLNLSFDLYTKTDTEIHKKLVQEVFLRLANQGLIFKKESLQYYSDGEKRFLPDRYVEGACPYCGFESARSDQCDNCGRLLEQGEIKSPKSKLTGAAVNLKPTEHYFIDWPKLTLFLKKYIDSQKNWRSWVLKETEHWLKEGLRSRPITRDLDWGVLIPTDRLPKDLQIEGAEHKRFYVWFEAVIGYLSASIEWGELNKRDWKDFWYGNDLLHAYFMGKDNLVFHTLFLPGELYGYDKKIHLPDQPFINQFLNLEGQKFSKSRGTTIDFKRVVETYGLDPVRFYLTSIMPESADTNFSWSDFVARVNDVLIGNFGNFINRTLTLGKDLLPLKNVSVEKEVQKNLETAFLKSRQALERGEFRKYLEAILELSDFGNKYMSRNEPWALEKKDKKKFAEVMGNALFILAGLLVLSAPLMPETNQKLSRILGLVDIVEWPKDKPIEYLEALLKKSKIGSFEPLFNKIDPEIIEKERSKFFS